MILHIQFDIHFTGNAQGIFAEAKERCPEMTDSDFFKFAAVAKFSEQLSHRTNGREIASVYESMRESAERMKDL